MRADYTHLFLVFGIVDIVLPTSPITADEVKVAPAPSWRAGLPAGLHHPAALAPSGSANWPRGRTGL
jgi:hypothetical protein